MTEKIGRFTNHERLKVVKLLNLSLVGLVVDGALVNVLKGRPLL